MYIAELRKVQLTILSDELCKEMGTVQADNLGDLMAANTRKELCGAFINTMNLTFVNYTHLKKQESERLRNIASCQ